MSWIIGIAKTITWTTEDWFYADGNDEVQPDSVKIELSRDNGSTWETIIADTPNTGSYNWLVAGLPTIQAIIKLSGVHNTEITFESSQFTIEDQIHTTTIINPSIAICPPNSTVQFNAVGYDQDNNEMITPPTFTWAVTGGGSIDSNGLFTAGSSEDGPFDVTATSGIIDGTASVTVKNTKAGGESRPWVGVGISI